MPRASLSESVEDIYRNRKTGLLSVTVKGENTMLKIFFRQGEPYHLTFGNFRGANCLEHISGIELVEYFFMPEVSLSVQDPDLPPIAAIMELFRNRGTVVEVANPPGQTNRSQASSRTGDLSSAQERLKMALVRQIGPAGAKVMTRIVEQKWHASAAPTRDDLLRLIELMKNEIENPADRNEFVKEAHTVIS